VHDGQKVENSMVMVVWQDALAYQDALAFPD
jgi:hypothetical protein